MTRFAHIQRKTWVTLYALATVVMLVILTNLLPALAAAVLFVLVGIGAIMLYQVRGGAHASTRPATKPAGQLQWDYDPRNPQLVTSLVTDDGEVQAARLVPLENSQGHQMLLTANGYMIVDDNGQVIYTIGPR